jgi:hypothetical protein
MSHSTDLSTSAGINAGIHGDTELAALCDKIRIAEGPSARHLPVQVLSYLAKSLNRIEIDIYVEECLPMVCDASHAFVRAMGTFSDRHADCDAIEQTRLRLIQALETLADEMRLCRTLSDPRVQRLHVAAGSVDPGESAAPTATSAHSRF